MKYTSDQEAFKTRIFNSDLCNKTRLVLLAICHVMNVQNMFMYNREGGYSLQQLTRLSKKDIKKAIKDGLISEFLCPEGTDTYGFELFSAVISK